MAAVDVDAVIAKLLAARTPQQGVRPAALLAAEVRWLAERSRAAFAREGTLLELAAPVKIVGDVHGQYADLLRILDQSGYPPQTRYLFLGDFVNRGPNSLECICLALAYKIRYPGHVALLRGNHESAAITRVYGFYDECVRVYDEAMWRAFVAVFEWMPLAAVVGGKIFCVHAGLSPQLDTLEQIRGVERPLEVPDRGLVTDLLWSDPASFATPAVRDPRAGAPGRADAPRGWEANARGVSYTFDADVVDAFLRRHDLDLVVRAHQVVENGYEFFARRRLVTVFSAPNYCGQFDNSAAVLCVDAAMTCTFEILKARVTALPTTPPSSL